MLRIKLEVGHASPHRCRDLHRESRQTNSSASSTSRIRPMKLHPTHLLTRVLPATEVALTIRKNVVSARERDDSLSISSRHHEGLCTLSSSDVSDKVSHELEFVFNPKKMPLPRVPFRKSEQLDSAIRGGDGPAATVAYDRYFVVIFSSSKPVWPNHLVFSYHLLPPLVSTLPSSHQINGVINHHAAAPQTPSRDSGSR